MKVGKLSNYRHYFPGSFDGRCGCLRRQRMHFVKLPLYNLNQLSIVVVNFSDMWRRYLITSSMKASHANCMIGERCFCYQFMCSWIMKMSDLFSNVEISTRCCLSCCNLFHSWKVPDSRHHDIKPTLKSSRNRCARSCKIFIMSWLWLSVQCAPHRCDSTSLGQVLSGLSPIERGKFCNFAIYLKLNIHTLETEGFESRWMNDSQIWENAMLRAMILLTYLDYLLVFFIIYSSKPLFRDSNRLSHCFSNL